MVAITTDYSAAVEQELLRRRPIAEIVDILGRSDDMTQPYLLMDVLSEMKDPQVDANLRKFLTKDSEYFKFSRDTLFWPQM